MQFPAGLPIVEFLCLRDLRSVAAARLVLATMPQMIAGLPQSTLERRGGDSLLPLHRAIERTAPTEVVKALLDAHPEVVVSHANLRARIRIRTSQRGYKEAPFGRNEQG